MVASVKDNTAHFPTYVLRTSDMSLIHRDHARTEVLQRFCLAEILVVSGHCENAFQGQETPRRCRQQTRREIYDDLKDE